MGNITDYTLLEIIEGPKRINNIPQDQLFQYFLESMDSSERFSSFIHMLDTNHYWAIMSLAIMSSDMIPFADLFKNELENLKGVKYQHGSSSVLSAIKMLLSYFEKGLIVDEKHRAYLVRYFAETLSQPEYEFVTTCLAQKYKKEGMKAFKNMKNVPESIRQFFSFCINREYDTSVHDIKRCIPVKTHKVFVKAGRTVLDGSRMLVQRELENVLNSFRNTRNVPDICEVHMDGDTPFMYVTTESSYALCKSQAFNDYEFARILASGISEIVCVDETGKVKSLVSDKNKSLVTEEIVVKNAKSFSMPMPVTGQSLALMYCESDKDSFLIYTPEDAPKIMAGDSISFITYKNVRYFKAKK